MSEKKVVRRSVAITLGIICILLIAFIAYFSITGTSAQNSYNNLQTQNKQLQTWLNGNETLLNQTQVNDTNLQNQIDYLNSTITSLQNQVNNLTQTLTTAQGSAGGWQLTMTLEKREYSLGEPVNITLTVTNISNQTLQYTNQYPDFDFRVYNGTNNNLYDWADTQVSWGMVYLIPVNPGESISSGNIV